MKLKDTLRAKKALIKRTEEGELLAPMSLPIEIGNALSAMFKQGRISIDQANQAFAAFRCIPVRLADIDMKASLDLSHARG